MKKTILLILLALIGSMIRAQTASSLNVGQANPPRTFDNPTIVGTMFDGSAYRLYAFDKWALIDTLGKLATKTNLSLKMNKPNGAAAQYIKGDGSVGSIGNGLMQSGGSLMIDQAQVMTVSRATDSIGSIEGRISQRLKIADTVAKWKPNSYIPSWMSITGKPVIPTNTNQLANGSGYISVESDPMWNAQKVNYSTKDVANSLYYPLLSNPNDYATNTSLVTGLASKFNTPTGNAGQYLNGSGNLSTFPTIPTNNNQLSNGAGYITGISGTQVTDALGYSPYNGTTNPNGYLTSSTSPITSIFGRMGAVTAASGDYNTSQVSEGANLYYTDARFDIRLGTKTTTNINEGINLYWTGTRFNTAFGQKTTTDLTEGANQYYTPSRFNTAFSGKTTTDLLEGTNQYFTSTRARNAIGAGTGITYNPLTGVISRSKRQETYSGATDASGNYTVTFATPYTTAPNIQQNLIGGNALQGTLVTNVSVNGFTVQAYTRSTVNTLPVVGALTATLVGTATNPLVGGTVHVLITEP